MTAAGGKGGAKFPLRHKRGGPRAHNDSSGAPRATRCGRTGGVVTRCRACAHPDLAGIEAALAAGTSARAVARRYGIGRGVISRHLRHSTAAATGPAPDLLDADPGRRAMAALDAALEALERAEAEGRLALTVAAIRGARSAARQVASLASGPISDADRLVIESLYERAVHVYSRCRGRGDLELRALSALRGILSDVRDAAGEVEGEVELVMRFPGSTNEPGVLIPASKLPTEYRDGGVIRLSFGEPRRPNLAPYEPEEQPPTNGNGRHG